jgi:hypothetical protein
MRMISRITSSAIFATLAIIAVQSASAADIKNWPKWMQPNQAKPAISTPAGTTKTMECTQCASATVVIKRDLVAGKPAHGFKYVSQAAHRCGGCRDTLVRESGTKQLDLAHNCTAEGQNALCCDTSKVSGRGV